MHNVPKGSETHFKVVVVSEAFQQKPLIQVGELRSGIGGIFSGYMLIMGFAVNS